MDQSLFRLEKYPENSRLFPSFHRHLARGGKLIETTDKNYGGCTWIESLNLDRVK